MAEIKSSVNEFSSKLDIAEEGIVNWKLGQTKLSEMSHVQRE